MPTTARLTKAAIQALPPSNRDAYVWETATPGFGCRRTPRGVTSFVVQYRDGERRTHRLVIGRLGMLSIDEARRKARKVLAAAEQGENPAIKRRGQSQEPTMNEILDDLLAEYRRRLKEGDLKPKTLIEYSYQIKKHIRPAFGKRRPSFVTDKDIQRFRDSLSETPPLYNRCRSVLCAAFDLAEEMDIPLPGGNPARSKKAKRFKEHQRGRVLRGHELSRLGQSLLECEEDGTITPAVAACFRLLALTGCRKNEIRTLHWKSVDFKGRCLHLDETKTGARDVPLCSEAVQVLTNLERGHDSRLFPSQTTKGHASLQVPWIRVCARAHLSDVTLHTLRHTWVTHGLSSGLSIKLVGASVGHKSVKTTERYGHLDLDPLHRTSEAVGGRIAGHLNGAAPAEAIDLSEREVQR